MARLGIDYGTTNTVVACHDRGRYPLVPHATDTAIGRVVRDVFPSLLVYDLAEGRPHFGSGAERLLAQPEAEQRYLPVRSLKRLLRDYADGARVAADVIPGGIPVSEALGRFAAAVRASVEGSGLLPAGEPLQAVLTIPANANGAQRHITRASFRAAGFEISAMIHEPSAAAIELADRLVRGNRVEARRLRANVAVFDLGGGTFDASVVRIDGPEYAVLDSAGIERLGGDDFDEILARMFAEKLGIDFDALTPFRRHSLLTHACHQKERLSTGSVRSLTVDPEELGLRGSPCRVPVAAYEQRLAARLEPAADVLASVANGPRAREAGVSAATLDAVYLVGGSSRLPQAARLVAERLPGVRLLSSDKPFTATATGAAIHSAETVRVRDVFARQFGVLRLAENGTREYFDPIFPAGLPLPAPGEAPVRAEIRYAPRHNIGRLRYLECATVDARGVPAAGARPWSEVLFPYDPALPIDARITAGDIAARDDLAWAETVETYTCDCDGIITVRIARNADGCSRTLEVFRAG